MPFKTTLAVDNNVPFRIIFDDTADKLNTLVIKHQGKVVATDANVVDENYDLPPNTYLATITFHGDVSTRGEMEIQTSTTTKKRAAKIREGNSKESISIGFELARLEA